MVVWLICKNKQFESQSQHGLRSNVYYFMCDLSVKINNLKANHNKHLTKDLNHFVWLICKNKQFESQSQQMYAIPLSLVLCDLSVKINNLKANHNLRLYAEIKKACVTYL